MPDVNCSRGEVVECSVMKPCWSGAGRIYLLIVGKGRVYMTDSRLGFTASAPIFDSKKLEGGCSRK